MEITSIASTLKIFMPVLPYVKKVLIFDTFFSLSNEKKVEAITYLTECIDEEEESLEKYKQELKLSEYKMSGHYLLNSYILQYYISNRRKHIKFCKSLFILKNFYNYKNSEVTIKKNIAWMPIIMCIIGLLAGMGAIVAWLNIPSTPLKWLYSGGCMLVSIQYVYYSSHMLWSYTHLRNHVKKFNLFISITRIKKVLRK